MLSGSDRSLQSGSFKTPIFQSQPKLVLVAGSSHLSHQVCSSTVQLTSTADVFKAHTSLSYSIVDGPAPNEDVSVCFHGVELPVLADEQGRLSIRAASTKPVEQLRAGL